MQPASMRKLFILILFLHLSTSFSLELAEQAGKPIQSPPKSMINNQLVIAYHVNDTKGVIRICKDTLFCIAQEAMASKRTYPNGISEPVIVDNYHLHNYDKNSLELIANITRITEGRHDGWHYYIFKSKKNQSTGTILFLPKDTGLPEKTFQVLVV